jgi:hypothetical protein
LSCDAERVTALVDGVLEGALRALASPELPAGLEDRVRRRLRAARRPSLRVVARRLLPLAAVLAVGLWLRGSVPVVVWELSRDHDHCFSRPKLPAEVWSGDPSVVADWFAERGRQLPLLPASAGRLTLVGARRCPLPDVSSAPHLYYASAQRQLSVFLVPHHVRLDEHLLARSRGNAVALVRVGGSLLGVVAEDPDDVAEFVSRLRTSVARLEVPGAR